MPADPAAARAVFLEAAVLDDPAARAALVAERCGGDPPLLARVNALLAANDRAQADEGTVSFADAAATRDPDGTRDRPGPAGGAGAVIAGKYTLVEPIGEGGMGSVWRAKQTEPVKRFVALKLIKAGMDSRQVLARFEAERQALALMDHPHIAKVLDGGLHDHRPFFVMELVKGVPITEYCDHHRLTPPARLELFVPVCQAIQHAHQKGVIHRDIKPSNVLVALYDDRPVVKVIDFGVAKATGGTLTEATIDTGFGGVVGTPQYMSPEQATFNNLDIDTRSDVYALGVLLYELLTGSPPFSRKELEKKGLLEILRVVREEEPPRPSTKLSTADALPSLAANRGTEPKKLTGLLRNELDWVVMKALEKDRTRRYETANGFAADVQRFLAGEPVLAHPPSTGYRLKKFVRRNRPQVIAASLVLLALVAGIVGTTLGLLEARRQEVAAITAKEAEADRAEGERLAKLDAEAKAREANDERANAQAAAQREKDRADSERRAKEEAARNLAFAKKGNELLGAVFAGLDPKKIAESGRPLQDVLRENLVKAVKELDGTAIGDPLEVAVLQETLGLSLLGLGEAKLAIDVFTKSRDTRRAKLGLKHINTLQSMSNLASAYRAAGKSDLALPLGEETYKLQLALFGPDHHDTLTSLNNLAMDHQEGGKLELAIPMLTESLKRTKAKLGPDHRDTLSGMVNLATCYREVGMLDEALRLMQEAINRAEASLGPDHPYTLLSMGNLAMCYESVGQFNKALALYKESFKQMKAKLGPEHPDTLTSMSNLATGYLTAGMLGDALPLLEETLKLRRAKHGPDHQLTIYSINNLAGGYREAGQLDKAIRLFEEAYTLLKGKHGMDHLATLVAMGNLGEAYSVAGQLDKALPILEETYKMKKAKVGPDHPETLTSMNNLAGGYLMVGQLTKALPLYEEVYKRSKALLGSDHPNTIWSIGNLGAAYCKAKQGEKATETLTAFVTGMKKQFPPGHPQVAGLLAQVSLDLLSCGQFATAEAMLRESLAIREKKEPDDWRTFNTQSLLGGALLGQKKYADAEPELVKGYEGLKAREKSIPPQSRTRLPEALDRLVELCTATNKPAEAAKYRDLRAAYREVLPPPRKEK